MTTTFQTCQRHHKPWCQISLFNDIYLSQTYSIQPQALSQKVRTWVRDEQMMNLTCVALAITADEMMNVYAFPFGNFHCTHLINLIDKACHKWVMNTLTNWSLKNLSSYKTGLRHFHHYKLMIRYQSHSDLVS